MNEIVVNVYGENAIVQPDITLKELAEKYQDRERYDIVLALVDNHLCELHKVIEKSCKIEFLTTSTVIGNDSYRRSATLLMIKAFNDVLGKENIDKIKIMYSLSKGYYCELEGKGEKLTITDIEKVKGRMHELVDMDIPIVKQNLSTGEVVKLFEEQGMKDKARLFKYRRVSKTNVYTIDDYTDYYYGFMLPSTGYLGYFDLILFGEGFVLQMPVTASPTIVPPFDPQVNLFNVLKKSDDWGKKLDIETVGALNDLIASGNMDEIMLVQEALQEKNIADIAENIVKNGRKVVLIAGPSSSGKTTFSHRLSIQLRAHGLKPHPIAMDNYFVDREKTPVDEDGKYNFECIEALDLATFNRDMNELLDGKMIQLPTFNFQTGYREYLGDTLQIGEEDVLVIEGIHGLNPKMTEKLPNDSKYKIYISALTMLNVDEHNRIPTTDGRLIRRIVRDARTRGNAAQKTISMWQSVRRGEEENIFPFQEEADAMFNSALVYELSIIKQYAEPLLFAIPKECDEYYEAKRLLKFLDYFLGISGENVPNNSILKEFIGGGCFKV